MGMAIFFVIIPYFLKKEKLKALWIICFLPSRRMVFSLLSIVLVGFVAALMDDAGFVTNGSLAGNRAEFDEMITYYVFLVYFGEQGEVPVEMMGQGK